MKNKKGFTLIELLVVIAIIGILSSIVLVSLGGARSKAKDARIQADLSQVRSVAEMINSDSVPSSYVNLCDAGSLNAGAPTYGSQLGTIENDVAAQGSSNTCYASTTAYCVSAVLLGGGFYCVDGGGRALSTSTNPCDSTNRDCL